MRLTIVQLIKRLFWKVKLQLSQLMYCNVGRGEKLQSCHSCKCVCACVCVRTRVCVMLQNCLCNLCSDFFVRSFSRDTTF